MKCRFNIKGIDCANCALELERAIKKIEGIENASISFFTEKLDIEYNESDEEEILKKLKKVIKKEEPDVTIEKA